MQYRLFQAYWSWGLRMGRKATEIRMCAGFRSEFCEMIPISLIELRKVCWSLMTVVKGLLVIHDGGAPEKEKQIQGGVS